MPNRLVLEALKQAYCDQVAWMQARAEEYETGKCQHHEMDGPFPLDKSTELAEEYRHRANNLRATMDAFERLMSKDFLIAVPRLVRLTQIPLDGDARLGRHRLAGNRRGLPAPMLFDVIAGGRVQTL